MKFARNLALVLLFCLLPQELGAQLYPMPGSKSKAPVLCTGCPGANSFGQANDGLQTYPYAPPLVDFVGRYVDSQMTANFQHIGFRTARARFVRAYPTRNGDAPPRVYIQIGNALGAYAMDTFFSQKLPAGPVSVGGVKTGTPVGGFGRSPLEKIAMFDGFIYPEATASQWYSPLIDQQDPMGKSSPFDVDDRGYIYATWPSFGWGIAKDDGRTSGLHFAKVVQLAGEASVDQTKYPNTINNTSGVTPQGVIAFREGSKYYAVTADSDKDQSVWDVTTPTTPRLVGVFTGPEKAMLRVDRHDATARVAYIDGRGALQITSYSSLVTNGPAIYTATAAARDKFAGVTFDEAGNVWAVDTNRIMKYAIAGATYIGQEVKPFGTSFGTYTAISVAGGHLAVMGIDRSDGAKYDVRLAKVEAGGARELNLDGFFKKYYHGGASNYAEPGQYTFPFDVELVKWGSKTYLFYSASGLGDVYEIQGGDSINVSMRPAPHGTANPNTPADSVGPFPGDQVSFVAASSSPTVTYDVSWDFGNTEAGSFNNQLRKSGVDVKHQYTGLNTAAKVTSVKMVRAVTIQDATIAGQVLVSLKLPTPRIGISTQPALLTAAPATQLEVVAGSSFKDASDGSIEGHYSVWTIDGVATKLKPNETIPVGGVGTHTVKLETFYGTYDASFNGTAPYAAPAVSFTYVVRPFRVRMNQPSNLNATTVRFSATPEYTLDRAVITATSWNYTWTLTPSAAAAGDVSTNAAVAPLTGTAPIGTIPPFDVLLADVANNSTVKLQVVVDPAGLAAGTPSSFTQAEASVTLTTPEPLIEKVGCENAGSPCSLTAKAIGGGSIADWTILWTVKNGNATVGTPSANNPFTPTLPAGNYTIYLKATKTIFQKEVFTTANVAQSLCGPPPTQAVDVSITKSPICDSASPCPTNTSITFAPSYRSYAKQACDSFSWDFGDGQTATGEVANYAYPASGTRTVTFRISNTSGAAPFTKTTTVVIGSSTPPPPPPPPPATCTAPSAISITYSGCTSPSSCRTTDSIQFTALRGTGSLLVCDAVAWTFGDNTTSNVGRPSKTFSTPGTYNVTAVVSNTAGTAPAATRQITIVAPPSSNCGVAPGPGNFSITYAGPTSGCAFASGSNCQVGEAIAFTSNNFFYTPASCDTFAWEFGDNQTSSERHPAHTYVTNGTYNVKLTVSNGTGNFQYTRSVTVTGGAAAQPVPVIAATSFPAAGQRGKAVTFTATSNMPTTTGWTWEFGNTVNTSQATAVSQTSTITHTFTSNGTFVVKAKARNSTDAPTAPFSGPAQAQIVITEAPAIPEYRFLLPVTAHANGSNNSKWRTDVQIYNPDPAVSVDKPLIMEALFKGRVYNLELSKATHSYEDFLGGLLAQQRDDQGPVIITTKNAMTPPQIWTRTYNQAAGGATFGQYIPAIRLDTAGAGAAVDSGSYFLSGLRHDDRYRTNVGFINPNASALTATITVYDERRLKLGEYQQTLQPFDLVQYPLKAKETDTFKLPATAPFSMKITVPAGQWLISYASFIDGISNDPVFLQAVRESDVASADHKVSVIPGIGHTGRWRSDVTIFNPDVDAVQFNLQYFNAAGLKKGEALGLVLDSGKFLQYGDLLKQGVLGNVEDGFGMLKLTVTSQHEKYPMTFSRTYFDDVANGTYGQGIGAFSAARANVKVNKPALIAGVRKNASYRTNIGLVNLTNAVVTATITMLDPVTGAPAASIPYELAPNQSVLGDFNGFGNMESGTLRITATGDVWAFASIIDRQSQDPEYVPATPAQ